jgi:hypothetical protein
LTNAVGYSDFDGYLGSLDFDTYMDRKRNGRLFVVDNDNITTSTNNNNSYTKHTAASVQTPCTKNNSMMMTMPEDMKREYRMLPSSYGSLIGNLAAESVEAAMNRLRQRQQRYRPKTAAVLDEETGMSQLEREMAILNFEV